MMMQTLSILVALPFLTLSGLSSDHCALLDQVSFLHEYTRLEKLHEPPSGGPSWPEVVEDALKNIDQSKQLPKAKGRTTAKKPYDASAWPNVVEDAMKQSENFTDDIQATVDEATNATTSVITLVLQTAHGALNKIAEASDDFAKTTGKGTIDLLDSMNAKPKVSNLAKHGNRTINNFLRRLMPVVETLNNSEVEIQTIMEAAGFIHLAKQVHKSLGQAVQAVNGTIQLMNQARTILNDLDIKAEEMGYNRTEELLWDLQVIWDSFDDAVIRVNTTFARTMMNGFHVFTSELRKTIDGYLQEDQMKAVNKSLNSLMPRVPPIIGKFITPFLTIKGGFHHSVDRLRAKLVDESYGAKTAGSVSLFILATSIWLTIQGFI